MKVSFCWSRSCSASSESRSARRPIIHETHRVSYRADNNMRGTIAFPNSKTRRSQRYLQRNGNALQISSLYRLYVMFWSSYFSQLSISPHKKTAPSGWISGTYQLRLQVCDLLPQLLVALKVWGALHKFLKPLWIGKISLKISSSLEGNIW